MNMNKSCKVRQVHHQSVRTRRVSIPALRPLTAAIATALYLLSSKPVWSQAAASMPSGMTLVHGQASTATSNGAMHITTGGSKTVLDWQSFSIGKGNSVVFHQPDVTSQVLNRVTGQDPSHILGTLQSNGRVWLLNPNGVLFGKDARIDVGGLVASTLNMETQDFLSGRYLLKTVAACMWP